MGRFSDEKWEAHEKVHKAQQRSLDLAFKELQRRLTVLNHAHEQMVERDKDYVRNDIWKGAHDRLEEQVKLLGLDITAVKSTIEGEERQRKASRANWTIVISVSAVAVAVVVAFLVATHHG